MNEWRTHGNCAPSQHPIDIHPSSVLSTSDPILVVAVVDRDVELTHSGGA
jgi:hypothetical protein